MRLETAESTETDVLFGELGYGDIVFDARFTVLGRNHSNSLVIRNVTVDDSGYYRCADDSKGGIRRYFYQFTVQGRPKIIFPTTVLLVTG